MYDPQLPTDGHTAQPASSLNAGAGVFGKQAERNRNERIRHLLKSFGLRTSLIRLKVIDALLQAAESQRALGCEAFTVICWSWISRCRSSVCARC